MINLNLPLVPPLEAEKDHDPVTFVGREKFTVHPIVPDEVRNEDSLSQKLTAILHENRGLHFLIEPGDATIDTLRDQAELLANDLNVRYLFAECPSLAGEAFEKFCDVSESNIDVLLEDLATFGVKDLRAPLKTRIFLLQQGSTARKTGVY